MHSLFRGLTRYRSEADRREIARRVAIYTSQVEQKGRIRWLPNVMKPTAHRPQAQAREGTNEPTETENR